MNLRQAFAKALKTFRTARGLTQEDFSDVSSRTYLSTLERGLKSPTIDKLQALAEVLNVHPVTILVLCKRSTAPPCQAPSYAMAGALIGSNSSIRL